MGFSFNCTSVYESVDYGLRQTKESIGSIKYWPLWGVEFAPSWANKTKPYASIDLEMFYVDSQAGEDEHSCPGTKTIRTCEIRPAVVQYPVTVMVPSEEELDGGNIVTHIKFFNDSSIWELGTNLDGMTQIDGLKVMDTVDLEEGFGKPSTVGALSYIMNNLYRSSANLINDNTWDILAQGGPAQTTFFCRTE